MYFLLFADVLSTGVCYGLLGDDLPPPQEVIALYNSKNIPSMRLYNPNQGALQALNGSGIQLIVGVPNEQLQSFAADQNAVAAWVQTNVISHYPAVDFRYMAVGNEVIPGDLAPFVLPAMANLQGALMVAGLANQIKVSTAVAAGVLGVSYPPSSGEFSSASLPFLAQISQFLSATGAPLLVNTYPYFAYADDPTNIPLDYALFTASGPVVIDGPFQYQNLLDAMVDAVYSALEKLGENTIVVVVSESGWPSAGGVGATVENAATYNSNLLKHVGQGTPKRPAAIEAYLFAMFNEGQKQAGIERNWGLFYPNKIHVYPLEF
ncbi:Glucan endo-1,3-beta-glucosidase [Platanthera guangdongensis]|uniref:Glucan endo-1,3-beta-glucosidase n=1 Tax=Platanthera guangdongensis TaxID=2320717 RepID=A0ABR2MLD1_9ASPA